MRNSKIAYKIPKNRDSFKLDNNELLVSVENGRVSGLIRGGGTYPLSHEGTEWYFVDEGENSFELFYDRGNISFTFLVIARVAFPTIVINNSRLLKAKMPDLILEWEGMTAATNLITKFLADRSITSEAAFFSGNVCELLERELMIFFREHFIKDLGMLIDRVDIKTKVVSNQVQQPKQPNKHRFKF